MPPDELKIATANGAYNGQRVLRLAGALTLQTVPSFQKVMRGETAKIIIVDFADVRRLDSAGVGSLIQTHVAFAKSQRRLALASLNEQIEAVLEITRVKSLFPIFESVQDAEANLG